MNAYTIFVLYKFAEGLLLYPEYFVVRILFIFQTVFWGNCFTTTQRLVYWRSVGPENITREGQNTKMLRCRSRKNLKLLLCKKIHKYIYMKYTYIYSKLFFNDSSIYIRFGSNVIMWCGRKLPQHTALSSDNMTGEYVRKSKTSFVFSIPM